MIDDKTNKKPEKFLHPFAPAPLELPPEAREAPFFEARSGRSVDGQLETRYYSTVTIDDSVYEARQSGSASWRTNNPGLLLANSPKAANMMGGIGTEKSKTAPKGYELIIFPDWESGDRAYRSAIMSNYQNKTITEAFLPSDPSKTQIKEIARYSGLDIDKTKIGDFTLDEFDQLINAIYKVYGYEKGTIIPESAPKQQPEPPKTWAQHDTSQGSRSKNQNAPAPDRKEVVPLSSLPATERRNFLPLEMWAELKFALKTGAQPVELILRNLSGDESRVASMYPSQSVTPIIPGDLRNPAQVAAQTYERIAQLQAAEMGIKLALNPDRGPGADQDR